MGIENRFVHVQVILILRIVEGHDKYILRFEFVGYQFTIPRWTEC